MIRRPALILLALVGCGFIDFPDRPLHPSIEDRRTKDDSLWAPLPPLPVRTFDKTPVPYVGEIARLPWVPATHRGIGLRHGDRPYWDRFIPSASEDDPFDVACETRRDPEQPEGSPPALFQYYRHCKPRS
jgi:hypothetical protein